MFRGELKPFQVPAVERMVDEGSMLVAYEMGLGKQQAVDEPVLTPTGWVPIGDLKVGDLVVGRDGKPTEVLGVYPQGVKEIARVTFQDGAWVDVGWEHLWSVQNRNDRGRGGWRTMTTRELTEDMRWGNGDRKWYIPMVEPVQFDPVELPVPPHVLGVILGDGTIREDGYVTADSDQELLYWAGLLQERPGCWNGNTAQLKDEMVALGLNGHRSWEKFIPEVYLRGTPRQRLSLLQGLLDTDGTPIAKGGVEYCTTSPRLMDGVVELVQSMGGVARNETVRTTRYTHEDESRWGRESYRVNIKLPANMDPFTLKRKLDKWVRPTKYHPARLFDSVDVVGEEEAVCIMVAAPDSLYVTRNYIVTHNTVMTIAACEELLEAEEVEEGLVICPSSLKYQWAKAIEQFTEGALVIVIDGPKDKRWAQYREAKDYEYVILNYEQIHNDWEMVRKLGTGFVVLDEATAIKTPSAKRTRKIKRLGGEFRFALTGQPVENKPEEVFSIMEWVDPKILGRADLFDRTFIVRDGYGNVAHYRNLNVLHEKLQTGMVRKTRADEDVAPYLPDVVETVVPVEMPRKLVGLYRRIVDELLEELSNFKFGGKWDVASHYSGEGNESPAELAARGRIMSKMLCLRMLCDHPALLHYSADLYDQTHSEDWTGATAGGQYAAELRERSLLPKPDIKSPKIEVLKELGVEVLDADPSHKMVVFSFFKEMLRQVQAALPWKSVQFTGDMSAKEKDHAKLQFQQDARTRLFLSSDAGGYGVDLPQSHQLVSIDLPWSAGAWEQRNSRIIRLSSEYETVYVSSLVMKGSLEERQYDMLKTKQKIGSAVVDGKGATAKGELHLGLGTLRQFLEETDV